VKFTLAACLLCSPLAFASGALAPALRLPIAASAPALAGRAYVAQEIVTAQAATAASVPLAAARSGLDRLFTGSLATDRPGGERDHFDYSLDPNHAVGKIVSARSGVEAARIQSVVRLGGQGRSKACMSYALTACAQAVNYPLTLRRTLRAAAEQASLRPTEEERREPGLYPHELLTAARALNVRTRWVYPHDWDEGLRAAETKVLKAAILNQLRANRPVVVGYIDRDKDAHAVALLEIGRNIFSELIVRLFDSYPGKLRTAYWRDLKPLDAIAVLPPR
jgi:hypothetical protein